MITRHMASASGPSEGPKPAKAKNDSEIIQKLDPKVVGIEFGRGKRKTNFKKI